jgi:hypothetical protein
MSASKNVLLPVNIDRTNTWSGHLPATRVRLRAILEQATARAGGATLAERALYAVCEFWSAVAMQTLERHLGANPEGKLHSMSIVYRAMGAKKVARALNTSLAELGNARTYRQRQQCISALESLLLRVRGPVDELISRFALRLLPQPRVIERRTWIAAKTSSLGTARSVSEQLVVTSNITPPGYVRWRTENRASG